MSKSATAVPHHRLDSIRISKRNPYLGIFHYGTLQSGPNWSFYKGSLESLAEQARRRRRRCVGFDLRALALTEHLTETTPSSKILIAKQFHRSPLHLQPMFSLVLRPNIVCRRHPRSFELRTDAPVVRLPRVLHQLTAKANPDLRDRKLQLIHLLAQTPAQNFG